MRLRNYQESIASLFKNTFAILFQIYKQMLFTEDYHNAFTVVVA